MTDLVRLKRVENMNVNNNDINFMDYFNPNSKIVLLGCSLNDNKMIFVLRSINLSMTLLMPLLLELISLLDKIFLVLSLPDGSPILVVPPPSKTIGVFPVF